MLTPLVCPGRLLVAALTLLPLSPAVGATLFWTTGGRTLSSARTDGSDRQLLLDRELGLPAAIVVNERDDQLYWAEVLDQKRIRRAAFDGTGVVDVLDLGPNNPGGIDLDLSDNRMYWTERFSNRVRRANLDGTNVETLVEGSVEPGEIDVDPGRGVMYWADRQNDRILRANLDGSDQTIFLTVELNPAAIEIDFVSGDVFWTEFDNTPGIRRGRVHRTDVTGASTETIASGLLQPAGLAYDAARNSLWLAHGLNFTIDEIDLATGERRVAFTGVGLPQYVALRVIPEPATVALLTIASAATFRGRRNDRRGRRIPKARR